MAGSIISPHALLGDDKLDFGRLICENVGPTRPAVIMFETTFKPMAEKHAAIKALIDADQFWPGPMK